MQKSTTKKVLRYPRSKSHGAITDVAGITVGHATNREARTGCTVILCGAEGAVCGVDVRGAAPGTRETDLLDPSNLIERVHGVLLTGGSAFGLDAAAGVVKYLEERGIGFDAGVARVPIVPAAVIFDLAVGAANIRPDSVMGYLACMNATSDGVEEGQVGGGAGAMVGKILGIANASPGGLATASKKLPSGVTIGVLVVLNAFGDVIDPASGKILTGAKMPRGRGFLNTQKVIEEGLPKHLVKPRNSAKGNLMNASRQDSVLSHHPFATGIDNTTLAVVATDGKLTKAEVRKVAQMAHDGLARAIKPIHTMFDGDTVFALSTGGIQTEVTTIGAVAAELLTQAVVRLGLTASSF
jgi:L-aminopeptidase/D-esterase-like protein